MRPKLAFETNPSRGRVRMVEVRRLAIEALAPVLFLERAVRQPDVGLRRRFALLERIHAASFLSLLTYLQHSRDLFTPQTRGGIIETGILLCLGRVPLSSLQA